MRVFILAVFLASVLVSTNYAQADSAPSAYDRVIKSGVIRCAYGSAAPYLYKDQKDGVIKGVYAEILAEAAKLLSLKIEYTEEPGYADFAEGLRNGRYDAFCAAIGIVPSRARVSMTAIPIAYNPQFIFVRKDDKRFKTLDDLNQPTVTMATTDGEALQLLTRRFLPNAKEYSLPNATPPAQLMMDVAMEKADAVLHDPVYPLYFNRDNPDLALVRAFKKPVGLAPTSVFTVAPQETALLHMINIAFQTLHDNGKVEEILTKYGIGPEVLYRMKPLYQTPFESK